MRAILISATIFVFAQISQAYTPISDDQLQELLKSFNYKPQVSVQREVTVGCTPQDVEYTTTYPQRDSALKILAKSFIPNTTNAPVVFILPPLGGANRLDLAMGELFCKSNIAAFLIVTKLTGLDSDVLPPVEDHDHTHRRVVSAIKGGIEILGKMPQINIQKIGLFGTSLGGILGSVAYGVMPEISAGTFLVNGGDVPFIMAYSDQGSIVKVKNLRKQQMGFQNDQEYENYLKEHLKLDPLHFAKLIQPETLKMYLATADTSVPSAKQMEFFRAVGEPKETMFYNMDHIRTIAAVLALGNQKPKIVDWFAARFALENPRLVQH